MTKPLYFWNGSSFELVGPTTPQSPFAYQTSAPTAPATGDIWIDSDGDVDTYNRQLTRYYFVASAGQTSVSGTDANGLTLAYVAGSEAVYVNGALQVRGVDYTATNGTSITNLSALALNDVVEVFAYTAFTVANAYTKTETDSLVNVSPGLKLVTPTSVAVGSGTASVNPNGSVSFSGCSTVSLNGCFSTTYDNYRIVVNYTGTGDQTLALYPRANGTDNSTGNCHNVGYYQTTSASTLSATTINSNPYFWVGETRNGNPSTSIIDIFRPFETAATGHLTRCVYGYGSTPIGGETLNGGNTVTTSYDGFTLDAIGSSTLTGILSVYGYKE